VRRSSRPDPASPATRPRSRWRCNWSNGGSWPGSATAASSPWPTSITPSARWSTSSIANRHVTSAPAAARLFQQIDQPALRPLPAEPYEYAEWKECRVGIDYHVEIDKHYYSVPHSLIRQPITARITTKTVELFHRGKRVAAHLRAYAPRRHTTVAEHMPSAHRRYAGWTQERLRRDADDIGPETALLIETILEKKPHPEQGFRACLGIVRLLKPYGRERLEAACSRALAIGALSYTSVASILRNHLDRRHKPAPNPSGAVDGPVLEHANLRGPDYFH
jgi:transposase